MFNYFYNNKLTIIMAYRLSSKNIWALGFMTFALFIGAGNIISPPMIGLQAGKHVSNAAAGFLLTAVGLSACADTVSIRGLA
ncbi:branched-chain amino acid transport system II (LIV-II) (LIVCS family) (fragment) [Xenorhabdus bovienii str. puntauvense]|uniref:Branched-chain amino acid transport system carrier protein n=1 Tax=Xenorhabdus bovienii str. puntauvense TaxID=1398201 RepID=A0A077NIC0_XENBV